MRIEDVLSKLEKHEAECALRYERIGERLDDQKNSLKALDVKIWGLAILIISVPILSQWVTG